jgi:hypothetical protein
MLPLPRWDMPLDELSNASGTKYCKKMSGHENRPLIYILMIYFPV